MHFFTAESDILAKFKISQPISYLVTANRTFFTKRQADRWPNERTFQAFRKGM